MPLLDKHKKRFYLLPGMGGRAYRRKQNIILTTSIIVGLLVAGIIILLVFLMSK